ncbi:MAG: hypothetical protein WAO00_07365 [Chthoniobacterales bacterium]
MKIHSKQLWRVQQQLGALLLLSLTGCVTSYEDQALRKVYEQHTQSIVDSYADDKKPFEAKDATDRNVKLRKLIYLVDRHYENWEKRLFDKKAGFDFIGTVSVLTVNAVGTLTGGAETKAILHAISGGIEGTKTAVDKDILQGQNTLAIITKMRELRSKKLNPLLDGMGKSIEEYSMEEGLVDLGEYYNAGTFTVALQDIISSAGKEKDMSDQANQTAKTGQKISTLTETKKSGGATTTTTTTTR